MTAQEQRISWSASDSVVVRTVDELDQVLDKLATEHDAEDPIIVIVDGPGQESVYHGVGVGMSFVSSCEMPYLTTVREDAVDGQVDYFFQGHHTPVAHRNLIPASAAREIVREFYVTGRLSSWQAWEPI